jgi:hypothetical protein
VHDRFYRRLSVLDDSAQQFLKTVAWLGGYVTTEQAQRLGIRNSIPRVHVGLKDLESWGFIKRVALYPAVYQVTKSVIRLLGSDLSARRRHSAETIRTRLLAVNFYLEAANWPVEFVFDHGQKIANFGQLGCEPCLLPQRAGKPYLWEDFVMHRHTGGLGIATVDRYNHSAFLQLHELVKRFRRCLAFMPDQLKLMLVVGTDARYRLCARLVRHPSLQKLLPEMPKAVKMALRLYRVQQPLPAFRLLVQDNRDLRELRALGPRQLPRSNSSFQLAGTGQDDVNDSGTSFWPEEGNE